MRLRSMMAVGVWMCCGPGGALAFSPALLPPAAPSRLRLSAPHSFRRSRGAGLCVSMAADSGGGGVERHPIYWIDECKPDEGVTPLALKNSRNLPLFLANKPVAEYNREAFEAARAAYEAHCDAVGRRVPIVLDSCCGTGRSTASLASLRPDSFVVGVDKSLARLERNKGFRDASGESLPTDNMVLVRANCIDFWRCAWEAGWEPSEHFILYPNPYPKQAQLYMRWHGSPAFPVLLHLGGTIQVRASWRTYLEEMAIAASVVKGPLPAVVDQIFASGDREEGVEGPLSNFEIKYIGAKQPVYRLKFPLMARVSPEEVCSAQDSSEAHM